MNKWANLRRRLDSLTLYLPLIVMAILALGSWWLVRSLPELQPTDSARPARTEPDYRLENFTVKTFDKAGQLTRQIQGASATHFPQPNKLHILRIQMFARNEAGNEFRAQANKGISSDDDKQFDLIGDVRAVRQGDARTPLTRLRGERITSLMDEDRLVSALPVEITRDRDVFTSETMDFNTRTGQYVLQGRVRSIIAPTQKGVVRP